MNNEPCSVGYGGSEKEAKKERQGRKKKKEKGKESVFAV